MKKNGLLIVVGGVVLLLIFFGRSLMDLLRGSSSNNIPAYGSPGVTSRDNGLGKVGVIIGGLADVFGSLSGIFMKGGSSSAAGSSGSSGEYVASDSNWRGF